MMMLKHSFPHITIICSAIWWNLVISEEFSEIAGEKNGELAVGGKVAALGELPYAAVVIGKLGKCTGSIIHQSWVLTAGHCVCDNNGKTLKSSDIKIMAGVIDFQSPGPSAQQRIATQIILHPDYSHGQLGRLDLALVQVEPFQLNNHVAVVGFASKEWPQDRRMLNRTCTSAGWGMLANRKTTSVLHLQRTIARHGKDSCPCIYKGYIWKRLICLAAESTIGICFGDSGGALVCDGEIVGVAHMVMDKRSCSYFKAPESTIFCESSYVFGIYMYTCPYLSWIKQHVPGVPPSPASCKGTIFNPFLSLTIISLIVLIIVNKY